MNAVKEVAIVPTEDRQAPMLSMIERLAAMPDFDVAKLSALLEMQERILNRNAESAFNVAFSEMQSEIPTITERAKTDKGKYAPREDIVDAIRPVLKKWGFSLSFRTEWPEKTTVKIVGILTHRDGHARESEFMSAADNSGSKNAIQALGSAVEYGRRYTTTDLLNIATRGGDDDGQRASRPEPPPPPKGFTEQLVMDLETSALEGWPTLQATWKAWTQEQRDYLGLVNRDLMNRLREKAREVKA